MSKLTDGELERLSILLSTGNMANARKIVRLLRSEPAHVACHEEPSDVMSKMLARFLRAAEKRA